MVLRLALLIEGEARISLGEKSVRQAGWILSVLDYGKVRDVSHLGKNRDGRGWATCRSQFLTLCQPGLNRWLKILEGHGADCEEAGAGDGEEVAGEGDVGQHHAMKSTSVRKSRPTSTPPMKGE